MGCICKVIGLVVIQLTHVFRMGKDDIGLNENERPATYASRIELIGQIYIIIIVIYLFEGKKTTVNPSTL